MKLTDSENGNTVEVIGFVGHEGPQAICVGDDGDLYVRPVDLMTKPVKCRHKTACTQEAMDIAGKMYSLVKTNHPSVSMPNNDSWALEIQRMNTMDKVPYDKILEAVEWATADTDFWWRVIMSPKSLRKSYARIITKIEGSKPACTNKKPFGDDLSEYLGAR
jgi:hypothetical protein